MVIENLYSSTTTYTHQRSSRSGTMMSMPACADYKKALDKFFAIASLITSVLPISSHSSLSPHSPSHPFIFILASFVLYLLLLFFLIFYFVLILIIINFLLSFTLPLLSIFSAFPSYLNFAFSFLLHLSVTPLFLFFFLFLVFCYIPLPSCIPSSSSSFSSTFIFIPPCSSMLLLYLLSCSIPSLYSSWFWISSTSFLLLLHIHFSTPPPFYTITRCSPPPSSPISSSAFFPTVGHLSADLTPNSNGVSHMSDE